MKKMSTYLLGLLSAMSASIGVGLSLLNIEIGHTLSVIGILVFGFIFLPLLFWYHKKLRASAKFRLGILAGLTLSMSVLFKTLHLQGVEILLWTFIGIFSLVFLPILFFEKYKEDE